MVATKTTAIYQKFLPVMTSSVLDVEGDGDSAVDRLREVVDARDAATWNFDFRTSTPLPGRYDWRRLSGLVAGAAKGHGGDRDQLIVHRGRLPSTLRRSSARRRLVFDEYDRAAADRALATFLLRRLISPQQNPENREQCSTEVHEKQCGDLHPVVTSTLHAAASFDNGQRSHKTEVPSNAENFHVQSSSSTDQRPSSVTTKRTRPAQENRSLKVTKVTGKRAATCRILLRSLQKL